ncbi:MAG: ABC transporter substrate-binding protein [Alphaproteobacteria bacterium]|nr:ABC transporter substrate-binding protein [Alphaproteobacteria bacterium]
MYLEKTLTLAATALALTLAVGTAQADNHIKTIKIGTEGAYPPFNNLTSDGQLVGFDIDIANALCEEMKVKCEFVTNDWDGIIPSLLSGKFDAIIASMSITDERKEKVDFTEKYYNTPPAIAVPKDSDIADATEAGLDGRIIGAQGSTTHSNYAEEKFTTADVRLYPTPDEYKLDIVSGRVDGVIDDVIVLSEWLKTDDGACCKILTTLTPDPVINGLGAGIAIRKGEDELREMFNKAITAIRENGKYKEINDKYFEVDVYGG